MIFEMYNDPKPENPRVENWQWQLTKLSNQTVIAKSNKGYEDIEECKKSIHLIMLTDYKTPISEVKTRRDLLGK